MGVSFRERMAGELDGGVPIVFEVRAEASHLGAFAISGEARLVGVLSAAPLVGATPVVGRIRVRPIRDRRIEYELVGEGVRFTGHKSIRALHPVRSMTTLPGTLRVGGVDHAGTLLFDLRELDAFLASWWASSSFKDGATPRMSAGDLRRLDAFGEALVAPVGRVPAWDATSRAGLEVVLAGLDAPMLAGLKTALRALDLLALVRGRLRFGDLAIDVRRGIVGRLATAPSTRGLVGALSAPIKAAHFGRRDYLDAVGYPRAEAPRPEPPTREQASITPVDALPGELDVEADVVVIGTGAGGATIAALLAERGYAVAIVEEGAFVPRHELAGEPMDRVRRLWRASGATWTVGRPPILVPRGRMVGGTTAINSGTCLRVPASVLDVWRRDLGFPDDFSVDAMARRYTLVEAELGVTPADRRYVGPVAGVVGRGADALGLKHGPLPRNAPDCDGQGTCIVGCPTDAKRSTNVSWIPRALRAGAALFTGVTATALLREGSRAVGIEARGVDPCGGAHRLVVRARAVVLACGTIEGARWLMDQGVRLPALGRNLSVHPALGVSALLPTVAPSFRAIPQGYGVDVGDAAIAMEGFWLPPPLAATGVDLVGEALSSWMDAQDRVAQFGLMVKDEGNGRVLRGPDGRAIVRYDLSPVSQAKLQLGAATLVELLLRGGADRVLAGLGPIGIVDSVDAARAIASARLSASDFHLLGAHPLGTMRMGRGPDEAVVDFDHRLYGTDNVYVVDGGTIPTSLGVNPQMTIMAFASRAADVLADKLRSAG